MSFFILVLIISNALFISLSHPLSLGLMLMAQTLIISIFSSTFMSSFWYSYILILVFLGGMLILFIYVASVASNEAFNFRTKFMTMLTTLLAPLLLVGFSLPGKIFSTNDSYLSLSSFLWQYSSSLIPLTSFLVIYLFFVLVAIVKITKFWTGALRPTSLN